MRETYLDESYTDQSLPEKIYIEPTDMCNLCCSMCFRHSWIGEKEGRLDLPVFLKVAEELKSMPSVKECFFGGMGEPLTHPDICRMIAAVPENIKRTMITNGTLLTREMSRKLLEAGLDELWLSVDGFCEETYEQIQLGSMYREILDHIRDFNEERNARQGIMDREGTPSEAACPEKRARFCVTFVLTGSNEKELEMIDRFADEYDVDQINISREIPGSPTRKGYLTEEDPETVPLGKMRRLSEGIVRVEEDRCPFITNNAVFIKWNGDVTPCMQMLHGTKTYLYEEERTVHAVSYGNVYEQSLSDCWNDEKYRKFRTRVREFYFPFCRYCEGCEDRKSNLSDCFVSEAPACGACLWASGRVFCP